MAAKRKNSIHGHLLATAREHANSVIEENATRVGLRAAGVAYPQIWARDAVIASLGPASSPESRSCGVLEDSLRSLTKCQSPLGRIPNNVLEINVDSRADLVEDTMFAGAVDASLWYIIGHYILLSARRGDQVVRDNWKNLQNAHRWLMYQDSNECGLLEVHESMDWADLFSNRYNSLLPNILWYGANRAMARMASSLALDPSEYFDRAEDVRFKINQLLWVGPEVVRDSNWIKANREEWLYSTNLVDTVLGTRPYYLPYMAFRDYGDRLDTFGNLLAILFEVANDTQSDRILDYISSVGVDRPWPIKACWPVVAAGEKDWREYYRLFNLNIPHQYHNGGAWPFLGGFYVAALTKRGRLDSARRVLVRLAKMNSIGQGDSEWEFNEWFHGLSGKPMGHVRQTWSAGMYMYAHEAIIRATCPIFNDQSGW